MRRTPDDSLSPRGSTPYVEAYELSGKLGVVDGEMSASGEDTVGESFGPNIDAAQQAGTLTGTAKRMNLAQRSVLRK